MDRRAFVAGAVSVLAAPLPVVAQQPGKLARIGFLAGHAPAFTPDLYPDAAAWVVGLRDHGYIVGQNAAVEFRSALGGGVERFPPLAAELGCREHR